MYISIVLKQCASHAQLHVNSSANSFAIPALNLNTVATLDDRSVLGSVLSSHGIPSRRSGGLADLMNPGQKGDIKLGVMKEDVHRAQGGPQRCRCKRDRNNTHRPLLG